MKKIFGKSNYDKSPCIGVRPEDDTCHIGWDAVTAKLEAALGEISSGVKFLVVECYNGVLDEEVLPALTGLAPVRIVESKNVMLDKESLNALLQDDITDDEVFGYMTRRNIDCYFDPAKVAALQKELAAIEQGTVIIYGTGAAWIVPRIDLLVYADMARWEIQMRYRKGLAGNIGIDNREDRTNLKYKRGFFVDWRICDRFKKQLMGRWDYVLDTNRAETPKLVTGRAVRNALSDAVKRPLRVVPFFDPGPWGGQWMKEVCDLDRSEANFAWCFDCVPEENSLLLRFSEADVEIPSVDLVFAQPRQLLGDAVHARFGDEFPIRFDFLDTMDGGNLSLQVHPLTEYIQEKFGMHYTQDESYYMLDTEEDAVVYLGLKESVDKNSFLNDLTRAQETGEFDAEKYIGVYPVQKHDHVLIPGGTIHCSGSNSMVLEISATPFIFTFKLWDWGRLGLDGRPRPINIAHGAQVIQWDRTESWVRSNILDRVKPVAAGYGWREEITGLHEREFIETRRFWFSMPTQHHTNGGVNVLNLVEGREAVVESPSGTFAPFVVHYAETFIVPAAVGAYTIRPHGESEGKECAVIKAFVRKNP